METEIVSTKDRTAAERGPTRTCAGCHRRDDAASLVRVVLGPRQREEDACPVAVDVAGGAFGRGAHVHARPECLEKACRGGLARAFKTAVRASAQELAQQIVEACDRRITGLLLGAWRAKQLALGADAAAEALAKGAWLLAATDAGGVVTKGPMASAVAGGRAIAWNNKSALGALLGRDEIAVVAVFHPSVASEMAHARRLADAVITVSRSGDACSRSREVR